MSKIFRFPVSVGLICVWLTPVMHAVERPTHDGKVVLFGNTHAHSSLSDDVQDDTGAMLPVNAFKFAHEHGLGFLAITDHQKAVNSPHRLWMTDDEYRTRLYDAAMNYNHEHLGQFIAVPGIEWGNTATGNHVNVFGAKILPPDSIEDVDYDELYQWAVEHAEFVQFNHPNSWQGKSNRNKTVGNFGEALYASVEDFVSQVDPAVSTVSIICTVAGGHISGEHRHSTERTHREMQWERYYKRFLNMGFRIAPAADQDTHGSNWGVVTAARTAVWADGATYTDLMRAFKACRVYATEDDEMAVVYQVRYGGKTYWMGETVPLEEEEADVEILLAAWQARGSEPTLLEEGPYTVDIVSDADGVGGREAAVWTTIADIPPGEVKSIFVPVVAGEYIYVRVQEQEGADNPIGDGEDEFDNETGEHEADGNRDDMNDSAWTAPIWFGDRPAGDLFVWSKRSEVYHDPDCWTVRLIGAANREVGPAPAGKRKHACHP